MKKSTEKQKRPFSKTLLIQESALLWIMSLAFLILAYKCIDNGFDASLPWLSAMVSFPWAAYGVSQVYYYKKSQAENTKEGITYETALLESANTANINADSVAEVLNQKKQEKDVTEDTTDNSVNSFSSFEEYNKITNKKKNNNKVEVKKEDIDPFGPI